MSVLTLGGALMSLALKPLRVIASLAAAARADTPPLDLNDEWAAIDADHYVQGGAS